jgi:hypothetical protein
MNEIEMFHVGENENGEKLYNLRYVKGGMTLPTPMMTEAQALAKISGTEIEENIISVDSFNNKSSKNYHEMTKKQLEALMRTHGIELDRRKSKKDLIMEVDAFFKE